MDNLGMLALYVLGFILIFYFLAIRPQQKQRKAHENLVATVDKGDRIVTVGGVYGVVRGADEDTITLEVTRGVTIKMARRSVAEILQGEAARKAMPRARDEEEEAEEWDEEEYDEDEWDEGEYDEEYDEDEWDEESDEEDSDERER